MSPSCRDCAAKCCHYFSFEIDKPQSYEEFENIRWYLMHKGVSVHVDAGDWYISIGTPCDLLGTDNRCTRYEDRPVICRTYSNDNCDNTGGDYEYQAEFKNPQELEAYARKTLGEEKFLAARAKTRASKG